MLDTAGLREKVKSIISSFDVVNYIRVRRLEFRYGNQDRLLFNISCDGISLPVLHAKRRQHVYEAP